jgi:hypothetical protein
MFYNIFNVGQGSSGPSITWDFSMLGSADKDTLYYNPTGTMCSSSAALFATTNAYPCQNYEHFADNDSLTLYAQQGYQSAQNYTDDKLMLRYPLAYNQTPYADTFVATLITSGSDFDVYGWQLISADGYGTLVLPDSTYSDVLRVRKQVTHGQKLLGSSGPYFFYVQDIYEWYTDSCRTPLLRVSNAVNLAVAGTENEEVNVSVFPNPVRDVLYVSFSDSLSIDGYELRSISGQEVKTIEAAKGPGIIAIHVDDLPAGLYFLHLASGKGVTVKKVLIGN